MKIVFFTLGLILTFAQDCYDKCQTTVQQCENNQLCGIAFWFCSNYPSAHEFVDCLVNYPEGKKAARCLIDNQCWQPHPDVAKKECVIQHCDAQFNQCTAKCSECTVKMNQCFSVDDKEQCYQESNEASNLYECLKTNNCGIIPQIPPPLPPNLGQDPCTQELLQQMQQSTQSTTEASNPYECLFKHCSKNFDECETTGKDCTKLAGECVNVPPNQQEECYKKNEVAAKLFSCLKDNSCPLVVPPPSSMGPIENSSNHTNATNPTNTHQLSGQSTHKTDMPISNQEQTTTGSTQRTAGTTGGASAGTSAAGTTGGASATGTTGGASAAGTTGGASAAGTTGGASASDPKILASQASFNQQDEKQNHKKGKNLKVKNF